MKKTNTLKLSVMGLMIALGVIISPILRVEGMCPMAHFINIVCSVILGPGYSLICAIIIGVLRMAFMGIPPIALTGAVFGAYLSGVFYRASKGRLLFAVLGEVIGTGIIGALASYPVMSIIWGRDGLGWLFYIPSFICGTLIGGSIAYGFLKKLAKSGALEAIQKSLSASAYKDRESDFEDAVMLASVGVLFYVALGVMKSSFFPESAVLNMVAIGILAIFIMASAVMYILKGRKKNGRQTNEINESCKG